MSSRWGRIKRIIESIRFSCPTSSNIMIYDITGSEVIRLILLQGRSYAVLATRFEVVYICWSIVSKMIKHFLFERKNIEKTFGARINTIPFIYLCYLISCVEVIKPKIVMTMIDNNVYFGCLSQVFNDIEFIAIQNAMRESSCFKTNSKLKLRLQHYYCYGQYEVDLYQKYGHTAETFHIIGSLKGGFFYDNKEFYNQACLGDFRICLVSQWREDIAEGRSFPSLKDSFDSINLNLARLIKETGWSLIIAPASRNPKEVSYFKGYYGDTADIAVRHDDDYSYISSYNTAWHSDLVLLGISSLGMEMLGLGKKVLYCNFTGDSYNDLYSGGVDLYDIDNLLYFKGNSYEEFRDKVNQVLDFDAELYQKRISNMVKYYMAFDYGMLGYKVIRQHVERILDGNKLLGGERL